MAHHTFTSIAPDAPSDLIYTMAISDNGDGSGKIVRTRSYFQPATECAMSSRQYEILEEGAWAGMTATTAGGQPGEVVVVNFHTVTITGYTQVLLIRGVLLCAN